MNSAQADQLVAETISKFQKYYNAPLAGILQLIGVNTVVWDAEGAVLHDVYGREFIDCMGGMGVFIQGHRHPKILAAVRDQLERLTLSPHLLFEKELVDLAELLARITPGDLQNSFFCNSGTEAVEGALKLARFYTTRTDIIYAENAFHGKTMGALSCTGREVYQEPFRPLIPGCKAVPYNDVAAIEAAITENTAAVILEPIQGEGGIIIPDDDYLPQVRQLCDENNVLLIIDEVQTGLGRTGELFAVNRCGVVPDILCLAKGLSGGIIPVGAFVGKPEIWDVFLLSPLIHSSTFGGSPLPCACAKAAIEVVLEEDLPGRARELGDYFLPRLKQLCSCYPDLIREVRGRGLMIGVEFHSNNATMETIRGLITRGVVAAYTINRPQNIRFEPPLIITREQLDIVLDRLAEALLATRRYMG